MKKIFTILLALIGSLGTLHASADYSGSCGADLLWTLDKSTGILEITGSGNMSGWSDPNDGSHIWKPDFINPYVRRIILPEGITRIGTNAFYWFENLETLIVYASTPVDNASSSGIYSTTRAKVKLFVPAESITTYGADDWWKTFGGIYSTGNSLVQFVDWDNTVLKAETVRNGLFASMPSNPTRTGYHFTGWNKTDDELNIIYNNLTVQAQYELGEDTDVSIRFIGKDDSEVLSNTAVIQVPAAPEIAGFTFLKWQVVEGDFDDEIEIQAVYTANPSTEAPQVIVPNPANPAQKLIKDGNIYILTDDKTYTISGQVITK